MKAEFVARPTFEQYLAYRQAFAVSRDKVVQTLAWAEPEKVRTQLAAPE